MAGKGTEVAFVRVELDAPLDGWVVDAEFTLDGGQVIHGPVTISPSERVPLGSLTAGALRRLSLHTALSQFEDILRNLKIEVPGVEADEWIDALTAGRRPGRRGQDPLFYLLWAARRVEAERVAPGGAIKWMVKRWGGEPHGYTEKAINKYVFMAREKGFLTPSGEPVQLTERARRLLKKGDTDGER